MDSLPQEMRASVASAQAMRFLLLPLLLFGVVGCGPGSPAEAHARLRAALAAHDSTLLWNALDQATRWSWMATQRAWREAYDITQSVVPEGPERARLLARFEAGATSENARTLFGRMLGPEDWATAQALVTAAGAQVPETPATGETSEIATSAGPLVYRKTRFRGWGFSGLASRAEQLKRSAWGDLDRMRHDAADYERAATRGTR
jgi:hypothetical protein